GAMLERRRTLVRELTGGTPEKTAVSPGQSPPSRTLTLPIAARPMPAEEPTQGEPNEANEPNEPAEPDAPPSAEAPNPAPARSSTPRSGPARYLAFFVGLALVGVVALLRPLSSDEPPEASSTPLAKEELPPMATTAATIASAGEPPRVPAAVH